MPILSSWLKAIGLERYAVIFDENGVDFESLPLLSEEDFEKLGVLLGHRKKLLKAIAELESPTTLDLIPPTRQSPVDAPGAAGERRQATVLFSDLSGYTAMNERLDPEVVTEIVGRIKAEAVQIVESHGGIVNQFVGDEILALFGIPIAHEDDPVRAVRAALALHQMVNQTAPSVEAQIGKPLRLHTGIDTGLVVTNLRDQRDGLFGITGDAVNTGARLAGQSRADEICVSPHTHQRIVDYFETEAMDAVALKGKAETLTPHRIVGPTKAETRFEAGQRRGLTGYTGRTHELATLLTCLERVQDADGQFVAVIGEAGTGKSRLLFEFRNSLDHAKVRAFQGRCQSYGTETPYLPFLDALRRALDLREEDTSDQLLEKVIGSVRLIEPALDPFLPYYLHLLSIPSERYPMPVTLQGAERRHALEEALAALFTLAAKRQPLVIVLEDWHWVDSTSDAVLKHMVGLIADYPLMIVLLCRPEYELNWAAPSQLTRIVLKPLSVQDTGSMACTALKADSMPQDLKALIHERTAGNPLFIEEVCNTLMEEGIVSVTDSAVSLKRGVETIQLPDTVQAVIRSRVDRLDMDAQNILQLASVIGREFARNLLARVADAADKLSLTLDALRSQDLIRQVRVLPEPEYIFKHVLTQVVVYETLLIMRRQTLHELVGKSIEALYTDRLEEHYESLAYHYQHSENRGKSIEYLELAGDKAKAQYVLQQTVKNYEQAIHLLAEEPRTPEAMRRHIDIAVKWADLIVPSAQLIEALELGQHYAEKLLDTERLANVTSFLGQMLFYVGAFERSIPQLQRVIDMATALKDQDRVGSCHRVLGQLYVWNYRRDDGLRSLETALPIVHGTGNHFEESCCLGLIAYEHGLSGRFDQSIATFADAIRVASQSNQHSIEVWNYHWRGAVLSFQGDWNQAIATFDQGISLARRIENLWAVSWQSVSKGYALFMQGQRQTGLQTCLQGLKLLEEYDTVCVSEALAWYAELLLLDGQFSEALSLANKALSRLQLGGFSAAARAHRIRAVAKYNGENIDWIGIKAELDESLALTTAFGYRPETAISNFRYAELLQVHGEVEQAQSHHSTACALFDAMKMDWWREQADKLRMSLSC